MAVLRWLLLIPVTLLSFALCLGLALGIYMIAESLCPETQRIAEECTAKYLSTTKEAILALIPPLAAGLMIVTSYWVAPAHKQKIAVATLIIGSIAATYYLIDSGYWWTFLLTELSAAIVTFKLYKRPQ